MPRTLARNNVIHTHDGARTVDQLLSAVTESCRSLPLSPLCLTSANHAHLVGAAAWLAATGTHGMVLPRERLTDATLATLEKEGFSQIDLETGNIRPAAVAGTPVPGRLCLMTSGTTGTPKIVNHTWDTIDTMARVSLPAHNWLITYQPGTYAWYQLITLLIFDGGQEGIITDDREPTTLIRAAKEQGATAISATPTFWRVVLFRMPEEEVQAIPFQQITLGGERVDQPILDRLRSIFPDSSLVHIYASSEAGAAIVVKDGREGFPAAWISDAVDTTDDRDVDRPHLQVRDDILFVRSPFSGSDCAKWLDTGDAVEVRGDRVFVVGRFNQSIVNVGGLKVATADVDAVLLGHPEVAWCRAYAKRAPLVGELLAAEIVLQPDRSWDPEALQKYCAGQMADHMVPRFWKQLESIPITDNLKSKVK